MPRPKVIIKVQCGICEKELEKPRWRVNEVIKRGGIFCCSKACEYEITRRINSTRQKYPQEGFQKGHQIGVGKKNKNWKGNDVGYFALHDWVSKWMGNPETCEHCGKSGLKGHQINWANKSRKYKRIKSDWIRLCSSCHKKYDKHLKSEPVKAYERKIARLL